MDGFLPTNRRRIRWRLLDENLRLNGINNVDVFPYAVSSKGGELTLDVSGGVAVQYRTVGDSSPESGKITVRSVALADVLSGLPGGACDFLKMDCEGAEYEMLLNLDAAALRQRVGVSALKYHEDVTSYSHADLVKAL